MRLIDDTDIYVKAGDGGDGCVSFRREKYVPRGGPNGGDGGDGGSIILLAEPNLNTLLDLVSRARFHAGEGGRGKSKNMHGANGSDIVVRLPVGTIVRDRQKGLTLADLNEPGRRLVVARGGKGGRGNARFASAQNQVPYEFEEGGPGQERHLHLELKLVADAGLIGRPNAGKSTLLSRVSAAHPKIASYPFTTLQPVVGIVDTDSYERFTMADLPGLIQGAHKGKGLGDEFLRHIERTRVLVHLVDAVPPDGSDPLENYHTVRRELDLYSSKLARKPEMVVATKSDIYGAQSGIERLRQELGGEVLAVSALTGDGLRELIGRILKVLQDTGQEQAQPPSPAL